MKKQIIKVTALVMALLLLCTTVSSCASSGKKLMELGGQTMSVNLYEFFLSRQKGTLCTAYYYGSDAKADDFWRTTISADGTTYNDYWTSYIYSCMKAYMAAMYLFEEEYKLTLPQSAVDEVDTKLAELVDYGADGSRSAFNALLSEYGVNYKMLRDVYILEAKINYLQSYLYGSDLSKVSDDVKEQYYQENYIRFKQIFLAKYYYIYETDSNGDTIYYNTENNKIVYDSSTGIRKFDESGVAIKDDAGSIIYYNADGSIAYDKVNGKPAYTFDSEGKYMTGSYSEQELSKIYKNAEEILEFTAPGDMTAFEEKIVKYSEDEEGQTLYPNGYYFNKDAQYSYDYINDIIKALKDLEVGDITIVESDYGYHIVMKYKPAKGGYDDSDNSEWFSDFNTSVAQWLFSNKCAEYTNKILVDEELAASVDMMSVSPNFDY